MADKEEVKPKNQSVLSQKEETLTFYMARIVYEEEVWPGTQDKGRFPVHTGSRRENICEVGKTEMCWLTNDAINRA